MDLEIVKASGKAVTRVTFNGIGRTVKPRRACAALALRLDLTRVEFCKAHARGEWRLDLGYRVGHWKRTHAKVLNLTCSRILQQVAPPRLVNVAEGRGALECKGPTTSGGVRVVHLRCGFTQRFA